MTILINAVTVLVAALHIYFLILEMFFWTKPLGLKVFAQTQEQANLSATLAANQGLYNGFLAAGIIWSLFTPYPQMAFQLKVFFLSCVVVAAIYGAYTVNRKILFIQGIPAALALSLLLFNSI